MERSHWWREVLLIAGFYFAYSAVRDIRGTKPVSIFQATTNARRIISFERATGIFHEATVQHWFLGFHELIRLLNDFYGTAHFIAVIVVLVVLFFWFPERYRLWRNTLALTSVLALVGFTFFPVLPPRLLPPSYGFVDTLRVYGGLWNFSSSTVSHVSNQYAAMPSLHTAWALWSALAVIAVVRSLWTRALVALYPVVTVFCIVVTANHYFLDAIVGALLVLACYGISSWVTPRVDRWYARRPDYTLASLENQVVPDRESVNAGLGPGSNIR